jgi:hypothetical protein
MDILAEEAPEIQSNELTKQSAALCRIIQALTRGDKELVFNLLLLCTVCLIAQYKISKQFIIYLFFFPLQYISPFPGRLSISKLALPSFTYNTCSIHFQVINVLFVFSPIISFREPLLLIPSGTSDLPKLFSYTR